MNMNKNLNKHMLNGYCIDTFAIKNPKRFSQAFDKAWEEIWLYENRNYHKEDYKKSGIAKTCREKRYKFFKHGDGCLIMMTYFYTYRRVHQGENTWVYYCILQKEKDMIVNKNLKEIDFGTFGGDQFNLSGFVEKKLKRVSEDEFLELLGMTEEEIEQIEINYNKNDKYASKYQNIYSNAKQHYY